MHYHWSPGFLESSDCANFRRCKSRSVQSEQLMRKPGNCRTVRRIALLYRRAYKVGGRGSRLNMLSRTVGVDG